MTGETKMHVDELAISDRTVRQLIDQQFPAWRSAALSRLPPAGTDNQLFRLDEDLLVRMPRIGWAAAASEAEYEWLSMLKGHLTLSVPVPIALGQPGEGYPWKWTVVPWIEGQNPTSENIDPEVWAVSLARFVNELREVPAMGGPVKTEGRGGPLAALDEIVQTWVARVDTSEIDPSAVRAVWRDAMDAPAWDGEPRWFHGDLHEGNLLVRRGQLVAVIDWGTVGRGDPAVELNAMWGYLPAGVADIYRDCVGLDTAAYRRARGYALQPALTGWIYYRRTAPHRSASGLATLRALVESL